MGFMDKAREAAQQATAKAQQGLAQGQAKFDEVQTTRAADGLLRDLGAAFYAEQRSGGSNEAVVAALAAVDAHVAAHGPLGKAGPASSDPSPQPPGPSSAPAGMPSGGPPAAPFAGPPSGMPSMPSGGPPTEPDAGPPPTGGFTLDDL
jgi:hypothetical protein